LYEDTIIPEAKEIVDALNMFAGNNTWEVQFSYAHLPVFSENREERANSLLRITTALDKALISKAITIQQYKLELQKFNI